MSDDKYPEKANNQYRIGTQNDLVDIASIGHMQLPVLSGTKNPKDESTIPRHLIKQHKKQKYEFVKLERTLRKTHSMLLDLSSPKQVDRTKDDLILKIKKRNGKKRRRLRLPKHLREKEREANALIQEKWLQKRGKQNPIGLDFGQIQQLKVWFNSLDTDKSGNLELDTLEEVLLSTGAATSKQEVEDIFKIVDLNHDGKVEFKEFVKVFQPPSSSHLSSTSYNSYWNKSYGSNSIGTADSRLINDDRIHQEEKRYRAYNAFKTIQKVIENNGNIGVVVAIGIRRRELLIDALAGGKDEVYDGALSCNQNKRQIKNKTVSMRNKDNLDYNNNDNSDNENNSNSAQLKQISDMLHKRYGMCASKDVLMEPHKTRRNKGKYTESKQLLPSVIAMTNKSVQKNRKDPLKLEQTEVSSPSSNNSSGVRNGMKSYSKRNTNKCKKGKRRLRSKDKDYHQYKSNLSLPTIPLHSIKVKQLESVRWSSNIPTIVSKFALDASFWNKSRNQKYYSTDKNINIKSATTTTGGGGGDDDVSNSRIYNHPITSTIRDGVVSCLPSLQSRMCRRLGAPKRLHTPLEETWNNWIDSSM